jgi:dihydrofolate synthase/folylpolyglutamate synthase
MPDHKDIDGAIVELGDMPVTYVRLTDKPRLTFSHSVPSAWETVDVAEINVRFLQDRGRRIAVLGTGYFVARMLALADVDTERLFTP